MSKRCGALLAVGLAVVIPLLGNSGIVDELHVPIVPIRRIPLSSLTTEEAMEEVILSTTPLIIEAGPPPFSPEELFGALDNKEHAYRGRTFTVSEGSYQWNLEHETRPRDAAARAFLGNETVHGQDFLFERERVREFKWPSELLRRMPRVGDDSTPEWERDRAHVFLAGQGVTVGVHNHLESEGSLHAMLAGEKASVPLCLASPITPPPFLPFSASLPIPRHRCVRREVVTQARVSGGLNHV